MATIRRCDYCEAEIAEKEARFTASLFSDVTDQTVLEKDACKGCADVIKRLLNKQIDRLQKALQAASDR